MQPTLHRILAALMICLALAAQLAPPNAAGAIAAIPTAAPQLSPCSTPSPPPPPPPGSIASSPGSRPALSPTPWAAPAMVKDINPAFSDTSSDPKRFLTAGAYTYFQAADNDASVSLWRTDGTPAGTIKLKIIGANDDTYVAHEPMVARGNLVYFFVQPGVYRRQLWRTDGTLQGTVLVAGNLRVSCAGTASELTRFGDGFFFTADQIGGTTGHELWYSDGSPAGTAMFKDLAPGAESSYVRNLVTVGDELYFTTYITDVIQLWHSDGTVGGTLPITTLPQSLMNYVNIVTADYAGKLFMTVYSPAYGRELWMTDGTAEGTQLLKDISPGTGSSINDGVNLVVADDRLYFSAFDSVHGTELWSTQGTSATTMLVTDLIPGLQGSGPYDLTAFNNRLLFSATSTQSGQELWLTDGTAAGTTLLKDINPGAASSAPTNLTMLGSTLLFTGIMSDARVMLWQTDGTSAGTQPITPICTGNGCSNFSRSAIRMAVLGSRLVLSASDDQHGQEPWVMDLPAGAPRLLKNISVSGVASNPQDLTAVAGRLFFTANESDRFQPAAEDLWISDGTPQGTSAITTFKRLGALTALNDQVVFAADDGVSGLELWRSDGTAAGTFRLRDIRPGPNDSLSSMYNFLYVPVGANVFFVADDGVSGNELWKTDGTITGTVQVRDLIEGSGSPAIEYLTGVGDGVFFTAVDAVAGRELWKSDGTISGTLRVKDINPGTTSTSFMDFATLNDELFFTAHHPDYGFKLWKSDGTAEGTAIVRDSGNSSLQAQRLTPISGTLFFTSFNGATHMISLWKTDGSAAGAVKISDLQQDTAGNIDNFTGHNGRLFFTLSTSPNHPDLWQSDGTLAGTHKIARPDSQANPWLYATALTSAGDSLLLNAFDEHGDELWVYSEAEGLHLWQNIAPESISATPSEPTVVGARLFFTADDKVHGRELWSSVPFSSPPTYSLYLSRITR